MLTIISCGKRKSNDPAPAKDLYTGGLFHASRRYAEAQGRPWVILSALHGLLHPDSVISPYDLAMHERLSQPPAVVARFKADLRQQLQAVLAAFGLVGIEVHGGADYAALLLAVSPVPLWNPVGGMTVGLRLQWYARERRQREGAGQ